VEEKRVYFDILTPIGFLLRSANVYGDKVAIVYGESRYTYNNFLNRVYRLANVLLAQGIGKGDKVAFICPNTPPMLEAHFAVPMIGAALVSINIRLSSKEVAYIIEHSDAKAVFVDNEFANLIAPSINSLQKIETVVNICDISDTKPLDGPDYEELILGSSETLMEPAIDEEYQVATINYTSGTTGVPKGVMYHHRGAYLNALGEIIETGLNSSSVYLWTLPMFHCNGWCFPWAVTGAGATHVCLRKVENEKIITLIEQEGVSHLCAAPTVLISMSTSPEFKNTKLSNKLNVITAGAPPSPTVINNMEALGCNIIHVYGLTETYGPHTICAVQPDLNKLDLDKRAKFKARQGVPYLTAQHLDVVDPETMQQIIRDGANPGEIVMRGNNIMLGYYKDPEATQKAFEGGWFHSGDLAVMHPDNYIQIMDRIKDIIISGGENISTVEVENVIYQHPDVLEVAVIGVPDEKWGEVPKAFIIPKQGCSPSADSIIMFCKENLARFKAPKQVEFGELPKTATGKIQKHILREKEWKAHGRKVN
jgi:fatty-acyl-CoA synthase